MRDHMNIRVRTHLEMIGDVPQCVRRLFWIIEVIDHLQP